LAAEIDVQSKLFHFQDFLLLEIGDVLMEIAKYKCQPTAPIDRTKLSAENEERKKRKQTAVQIIECALEFYKAGHKANPSNITCLRALGKYTFHSK
jgi:hypothetical protein